MLWDAGARLRPASRPGRGALPPDARYVLSASAAAVRGRSRASPSSSPVPRRGPLPRVSSPAPTSSSTLLPATLHLGPFPCVLSLLPPALSITRFPYFPW